MIIAIPSTRPDMDGMVERKLGTAAHLLMIDTSDMSFEAIDGPPSSSGHGAGVTMVSLAVGKGAQALLVGHVAPYIANALNKKSITVVTGISGTISEVVAEFLKARSEDPTLEKRKSQPLLDINVYAEALIKALSQFYSLLPRLVGVILLLGLFRGFISEETLFAMFPNSTILNSLWGASLGSVMAGNPVNSYVIGKSMLVSGVGLAGVTALMMAWVNVGVIQLPAETAALGRRFALVRNITGFALAVIMSFIVLLIEGGWQ